MAFDPKQFGATPFDPAEFGAVPAEEKGILPKIGETLHSVAKFVAPQTTKLYEQGFGTFQKGLGAQEFANKLAADTTLTPEQKKQKALEYMKQVESGVKSTMDQRGKAGLELASYIPATGPTFATRAAVGAARGLASGLSQENVSLPDIMIRTATGSLGESVIPEVAKKAGEIVKPVIKRAGEIIKTPSYGKTAQLATDIAEKGAKEGKGIEWGDLSKKIESELFGEAGQGVKGGGKVLETRELRKAFNKFITEQTPEMNIPHTGKLPIGAAAEPRLDTAELLKLRKQFPATYGDKTFFQNLIDSISGKGKSPSEELVAKHARNVVSRELQNLVPDIKDPDKLYAFYKKLGGDVPTWAKRAIGAFIADKVLKNTVFKKAIPGAISSL